MICVLCHQLLQSYKGLCIYAHVLYHMKSHWCIVLSLYKILSKTLNHSSKEIFTKKVQDQTYGLILLNFYEDNSPIITRSYFLQIFLGDTLYSPSYSEDTNIHVFTHSTS